MKSNTMNAALIKLYLDVLQQPATKRYNMKALILDTVPAKRMLYQVYMSVKGFDVQQPSELLASLPPSEVRFISFLEGTLFTEAELSQIMQAHAAVSDNVPEKYCWRGPQMSKGFAFYGRKFGQQPSLNRKELDNLYSD